MSLLSDIKDLRKQQEDTTRHWWETARNEASINGVAAQSVLNEAKDTLQEQNQQNRDVAAVGNLSDRAVASMQASANNEYMRGVRNLASSLSQQRQNIDRDYLSSQQQLLQNRINEKQQRINNISQAASGLASAAIGAVGTAVGGPIAGAVAGQVASTLGNAVNKDIAAKSTSVPPINTDALNTIVTTKEAEAQQEMRDQLANLQAPDMLNIKEHHANMVYNELTGAGSNQRIKTQ